MVVKDRFELTHQTLMSLYFSDQKKSSYDLFIIDNGSSKETTRNLREFVKSGLLPVKNLMVFPEEQSLSLALNLFLCLSDGYKYRLKMDNDLIFPGTLPSAPLKPPASVPENALSGAPRSVCRITGAGAAHMLKTRQDRKKEQKQVSTSAFLDHMIAFSEDYNAELVSLVPVSPEGSFYQMFVEVSSRRIDGRPYLFGACMLITKNAFKKLGYFDERIRRRIDVEYSQRAIRNGINIGYHPAYWVKHMGTGLSTDSREERDAKYSEAMFVAQKQGDIPTYGDSMWDRIKKKINAAAKTNVVVTLD